MRMGRRPIQRVTQLFLPPWDSQARPPATPPVLRHGRHPRHGAVWGVACRPLIDGRKGIEDQRMRTRAMRTAWA